MFLFNLKGGIIQSSRSRRCDQIELSIVFLGKIYCFKIMMSEFAFLWFLPFRYGNGNKNGILFAVRPSVCYTRLF